MNVTLNIENDAELRAYVKDLIRGQVKSIIREEIKDLLREELTRRVKATDLPAVEVMMKEEISNRLHKELGKQHWGEPSFIQKEARILINNLVRESLKTSAV